MPMGKLPTLLLHSSVMHGYGESTIQEFVRNIDAKPVLYPV